MREKKQDALRARKLLGKRDAPCLQVALQPGGREQRDQKRRDDGCNGGIEDKAVIPKERYPLHLAVTEPCEERIEDDVAEDRTYGLYSKIRLKFVG
jgi:hypothetical protein